MRGVQHELPSIQNVIDMTIACGRLTNPAITCTGIAVNTQKLGEAEARALLENLAGEYGVPATDPIRFGVTALVDRLEAINGKL
jgi:uncharacterized NAD-dependent epimerase/dehydratase family protein